MNHGMFCLQVSGLFNNYLNKWQASSLPDKWCHPTYVKELSGLLSKDTMELYDWSLWKATVSCF